MGDDIVDQWEVESISSDSADVEDVETDIPAADAQPVHAVAKRERDTTSGAEPQPVRKRERIQDLKIKRKTFRAEENEMLRSMWSAPAEVQAAFLWTTLGLQDPAFVAQADPLTADHFRALPPPPTTKSDPHRTSNPTSLVSAVKTLHPHWKKEFGTGGQKRKGKAKAGHKSAEGAARGHPKVLIVCANAARCNTVFKQLLALRCFVAKCASKSAPVARQVQMLTTHHTPVCVGTSHRLQQLVGKGALGLSLCRSLIVDCSFTDKKRQNIFQLKDSNRDFLRFYGHCVHKHIMEGRLKITFT